jgi:hypothetical protein
MSNCIIKLGGKYLIWSTVVDAPITRGMTLEQLREWVKAEAVERALRDLPERLARVEAKGTSAFNDASVADTIYLNHAGEGESHLSKREIIRRYCGEK